MAQSKKYSTLMSNTLLFAISNFSSKILGLIMKPYLTYALGDPGVMGVQSLLQQCTNLLIPAVSLGVSFAIIRFGLEKTVNRKSVFTNGFVTILLGFFVMVLAFPLVRLIPTAGDYLVLLYISVLVSCLRTLCTQFIRSRMLNRLVAVDGVLTSASLFGFIVLFLNVLHLGAEGYILAVICSDALSTVFVFWGGGCRHYLKPQAFNSKLWKEMLRYCLPMIPASISFWVINASDLFFVDAMCNGTQGMTGKEWTGLLSAAYFLPTLISTAGSIFYEAWQLSAVTEQEDRAAFFSRVFHIYGSVMFCCASGVIWLCRPLMHIFKDNFYSAWQFVPFLALGALCTCFNQFLNSVYVVYKRSASSLFTMLSGAVLNVVLNGCFIRLWGPIGVTPASFLSLLLVFLLRAYSTRGLLDIDFRVRRILVDFALVGAQIFVLYFMKDSWVVWNTVLMAIMLLFNRKSIWGMVQLLLRRFLPKRQKS